MGGVFPAPDDLPSQAAKTSSAANAAAMKTYNLLLGKVISFLLKFCGHTRNRVRVKYITYLITVFPLDNGAHPQLWYPKPFQNFSF
jgi:hypothetical protein